MVNKTAPKRIQALQRAMTLIEAIALAEDGVRIQELAPRVGLTPGAVHHILDTLAAQGWVERLERPVRYGLGPAIPALARGRQQRRLMQVVEEEMLALRARLGCGSVSLCEATGLEIQITRQADGSRTDATSAVAGTILPPYTSAASVVHLACWPEERAQAYRELRPFEVHGGPLWGEVGRFEAALAAVRRDGYVDLPLKEAGSVRIGVPVRGAGGGLAASLTLSAHRADDAQALRDRFIAAGLSACIRIRQRLEEESHADHP